MNGFGSQPFGSTLYGLGVPVSSQTNAGIVLRNPSTLQSSGSRYIDPARRDYVLDSSGRLIGMDETAHLVLMAVSTARNRSAVPGFGHRLGEITVINDTFERDVTAIYEEALADLIARNRIALVSVDVQRRHPGAVQVRVNWRDLRNEQLHTTEV